MLGTWQVVILTSEPLHHLYLKNGPLQARIGQDAWTLATPHLLDGGLLLVGTSC